MILVGISIVGIAVGAALFALGGEAMGALVGSALASIAFVLYGLLTFSEQGLPNDRPRP